MSTTTAPAAGRVRALDLPAELRAQCTLTDVAYEDAFVLARPGHRLAATEWARAVLEQAPFAVRARLVAAWLSFGLGLGAPWSRRTVLGWPIAEQSADHVLLSAPGRVGMSGQLLFACRPDELWAATFVQLDSAIARTVWAVVEPRHRRVVPALMRGAWRRGETSA